MRFAQALLVGVAIASAGNGVPDERTLVHMRARANDLRTVQRLIFEGRLEDAEAIAFLLTKLEPEFTDAPNGHEMIVAGALLAEGHGPHDLLQVEAQVAVACAHCHLATKPPALRLPAHAPPNVPSVLDQMARHEWAADRLLEGLTGPSDVHWNSGLYLLANTALPETDVGRPDLARALRVRARQLYWQNPSALEDRAAAYVELMSICTGCHEVNGHESGPRSREARRAERRLPNRWRGARE